MKDPATIVAEVTKNWVFGEEPQAPLISQMLENVITVNAGRGYELADWKLGQLFYVAEGRPVISETIIAIFNRKS